MELTHLSLFSGIGGLDLAAEWAGFETVGQCEWADYPTKVLEKHWPDVPKWRDIREFSADEFERRVGIRTVTCISGGFPCQPHSLAGKRKASGDERDMWPEYRRVISEVMPGWVVAENVRGLLTSEDGRFFRGILRDLSDLGFNVGWCTYPAAWAGAVHRRERVFTIAYADSSRCRRWMGQAAHAAQEKLLSHNESKRAGRWPETAKDIVRYIQNPEAAPEDIRSNYGASDWVHRLKAIGNMVMPEQAVPIFAAIAEIERRMKP